MNWGNRLLLVFAVFGGGMSYMVYRCMQTPVDLVSKDYYKEELAYQQVIDGTRRANGLSGPVRIDTAADGVRVVLPAEMRNRMVTGQVRFYCPADASRDRKMVLNMDVEGGQVIPREAILAGQYTVSVSWETGGVGYYSQQSLVIH